MKRQLPGFPNTFKGLIDLSDMQVVEILNAVPDCQLVIDCQVCIMFPMSLSCYICFAFFVASIHVATMSLARQEVRHKGRKY